MRRSRAISVQIARPFEEVYAFLSEPSNFSKWGPVEDSTMTHLGGRDYLVHVPRGPVVLRFVEPNRYGVLDYWAFPQGTEPGPVTSSRLVPKGQCCLLTILWLQR